MKNKKNFLMIIVILLVISIISLILTGRIILSFSFLENSSGNNGILEYYNDSIELSELEKMIVWVKYRVDGKHRDGSYFENSGGSGSGILYGREGTNYLIITNRHVVDCAFHSVSCYQRLNETISVRTYDGKTYSVKRVLYAPSDLDIAVLEVDAEDEEFPTVKVRENEIKLGEKVIAIGYPRFIRGFTELLASNGTVTNKRIVVTSDGFGFEVINSDAYTNFGSSGGGLFDSKGELIGINTWKTGETSLAASVKILSNLDKYNFCNEGYYLSGSQCVKYCRRNQVLGKNGRCQSICDSFYCESIVPDVYDERCVSEGRVFGDDGICHFSCEFDGSYCSQNSICFKNRCASCADPNTYIFRDGTCRFKE